MTVIPFMYLFVILTPPVAKVRGAIPFVLDSNKPYVYISYDHSGPRRPVFPGEKRTGLWFRFNNNCRLPVGIYTFEPGTNDPGKGVIHDVVTLQNDRSPHQSVPPPGYSFDVRSLTTIQPGESVLFSVPLNHLTSDWYIGVEFTLQVSPSGVGDQPLSYADFRWDQLPREVRGFKK